MSHPDAPDLSPGDVPSGPAIPEPSALQLTAANSLGAMFRAYMAAGFTRVEAYGLAQVLLVNSLQGGGR